MNDRRTVMLGAMAAALAPVLAARAGAVSVAGGRFAPPGGPMTFTRRLERGLPGGASLVVWRSFAVRFAPVATGWAVAGQQDGVTVDAPERIAQLAALERRRVETGLFPLALDRAGMIVGGPDAHPAKELDQAIAVVRRELDKEKLSADARAEFDAFVRAVGSAGSKMTSAPPGDLFAPRELSTHAQRDMALPGGGAGMIEVSFSAATDPATGLMRSARREIVTTIADDRRVTREDWTLAPA